MNFDGVWEILDNSIPPEICHYRQGHHPGVGWWLKTVVPNSDPIELLKVWQALAAKHHGLISISAWAYDWQEALIPNCSTIWIRDGADIELRCQDLDITYVIYPFDDATNSWGNRLRRQLNAYRLRSPKNFDKHSWHNLAAVAHLLKHWTTERQAHVNRKGWKVVTNSEKDSSSPSNRSKLDSK
jgi:hypothetical protein